MMEIALNKENLREDFSKNYKKYYYVELFKEKGFERKQCRICRKFFWTLDSDRELCGDSAHEPYSFIKNKTNEVEYKDFWKIFSDFFKKNGHSIIEKYPVVSRWRNDLYYTIASIQDFQRIENNKMTFEYPANPLIVPQICLRFNDISNIGITGRHFTSFMMAGQHSFDYPKHGYWKDKTIQLNFDFLIDKLNVDKKNLTYVEDVWAMGDFSEFGPCLESFSNGLELVNSVFTEFEYSNRIKELDSKVVDVGWGFERLVWFYSGSQTAYDAVFKNEINYINKQTGLKPDYNLYSKIASVSGNIDLSEKNSKDINTVNKLIDTKDLNEIIKPMQASYIISDHLRTLLFAINDGALPSNVGGGYNLRIILRRIFDIMETYNINMDLIKVIEIHAKDLKNIYNDIDQNISEISEIFDIEKIRYQNNKDSALKIVNSILEKKENLNQSRLKTLYESNGITPQFITNIAKQKNLNIDIDDSYLELLKNDFVEKIKNKIQIDIDISNIAMTEKLYYLFKTETKANVIKIHKNIVILDKTVFYPEGGGQESDSGTINNIKVKNVQIMNGVIIHELEQNPGFKINQEVSCIVDKERRLRLMAHHTATHLISNACRKILGKHAWQEGSLKTYSKAHIDIAHYQKLTKDEVKRIEDTVNNNIINGIKVNIEELERNDAETRFGFTIYQGHGVPAKKLRIVEIKDLNNNIIDAEACGGLHLVNRESSIGLVKIIKTMKIHDGIDRIEFVAGLATLDYFNKIQNEIENIAEAINADPDKVYSKALQQFNDLNKYKKNMQTISSDLVKYLSYILLDQMESKKDGKIIKQLNYDRKILRDIGMEITGQKKLLVLLYNNDFDVVCISSSHESAIDFIKKNSGRIIKNSEFSGGGTEKICEGKLKFNLNKN